MIFHNLLTKLTSYIIMTKGAYFNFIFHNYLLRHDNVKMMNSKSFHSPLTICIL